MGLIHRIVLAVVLWALGLSLMAAGLVLALRGVWLVLVPLWGQTVAAFVLAAALLLIGAGVLAFLVRRKPAPAGSALVNVVAAFAQGFGTGQALRARR